MRRFGVIRRLTIWLALGCYGLVVSGLPLPLGVVREAGRGERGQKDRSVPFPCMDSPCGCDTAEQCYTNCCCHTPTERLAWARARGLEGVVATLVALRSGAAPVRAADSQPGSGGSHESGGCGAKRSCCESGSTSRPRRELAIGGQAAIASPEPPSKAPWVGPDICFAYRHLAGRQVSHRLPASPGGSCCAEGVVMDGSKRDPCGDSMSHEAGSRDAEGGRSGTPRGGRSVTLRAMLACGGIVSEWLAAGICLPPPAAPMVWRLAAGRESIELVDQSVPFWRPAPDVPPPRAV
jgi:hypothetical protein